MPTANILHNGNVVGHCYRTIYTGPDGKLYKREQDCPAPWQNLSSIGVPVVGPAINMDGIREATHFRVKPSGTIVLY
ncbi:hypothetical protein H7X87_01405 [Acetobacteraceae bacterium]|nr:hypothetical protein [Candidatus Parcubacteria bacterium]